MESFLLFLKLNIVLSTVAIAAGHNNCKTMATFNAGLINSVGQQDGRLPRIIDALKKSRDDFICMQEVWLEKDMTAILDGVKTEFPHHWSKIHASRDYLRQPAEELWGVKDTPCRISDAAFLADKVYECGKKSGCFSVTGLQQSLCLVMKCSDLLKCGAIRESCVSCLSFKAPTPFEDAIRECTMPLSVHNRVNAPGLLILSKQRLRRASYQEYFPLTRVLVERGYIHAQLSDGKRAVCTHLTSVFPVYLESDLPFSSYVEQASAEITKLGTAFAGRRHILLGDFNTGPTVSNTLEDKNLTGEFPQNYDKLLSFGYRAPYMEQDGRCTYCLTNSLTGGSPNNVIDQVLVSPPGSFSTPLAERVFDTEDPEVDPPLSDHYGARVEVCDP